jgi:hypothetical protein
MQIRDRAIADMQPKRRNRRHQFDAPEISPPSLFIG